mmetsp:Transcript_106/g.337  ORF Transcript_106/g.337 Transcript_106/m.337 type:complete len:211 (-) Transcript_106:148-780(-)
MTVRAWSSARGATARTPCPEPTAYLTATSPSPPRRGWCPGTSSASWARTPPRARGSSPPRGSRWCPTLTTPSSTRAPAPSRACCTTASSRPPSGPWTACPRCSRRGPAGTRPAPPRRTCTCCPPRRGPCSPPSSRGSSTRAFPPPRRTCGASAWSCSSRGAWTWGRCGCCRSRCSTSSACSAGCWRTFRGGTSCSLATAASGTRRYTARP